MDKETRLRSKQKPRVARRNFQLENAFRCRNAGAARNSDGSPTIAYAEWLEKKIEEARDIALRYLDAKVCVGAEVNQWLRET